MATTAGDLMRFTLERNNDLPLEFDGELVAEQSSQEPSKPRWTVMRLYVVDDGRGYVVESVGVSTVAGEVELRSASHCATVVDLIAKLRRYRKDDPARGLFIPDLAWDLLCTAHEAGALELPDTERV